MLGEGHILIYGTLQIGHTIHEGHQRLQCWQFPDKKCYGFNQAWKDFVFTCPPGVERFVLSPDNVWYGLTSLLKLLFTLSVYIDGPWQAEPVELECADVLFCSEIKLEPSGMP